MTSELARESGVRHAADAAASAEAALLDDATLTAISENRLAGCRRKFSGGQHRLACCGRAPIAVGRATGTCPFERPGRPLRRLFKARA